MSIRAPAGVPLARLIVAVFLLTRSPGLSPARCWAVHSLCRTRMDRSYRPRRPRLAPGDGKGVLE